MQLNHQIVGAGSPVVLLHGLFGSLDNLGNVARVLASDFTVISVDQRNHGRSPHHPVMNYGVMASDLAELIESHHWGPICLIGHSMGGKTAMEFALSYPQLVAKLVVVDIAPKAYPPYHEDIIAALLSLDLSQFETRSAMEDALAEKIPGKEVRRFLLKSVTRNSAGRFEWLLGLREIQANYSALAARIDGGRSSAARSLFIRGGRSDYVQDADLSEVKRLFPNSEISTISGAGHWVHADAPAEFLRNVAGFLKSEN